MAATLGTAIVTGAAKGIGRAIAERLAGEGYRVVALDRLEAVHEVAAAIRAGGGDAVSETLDIRDRAAIAAVMEKSAPIEVIVNNAAITSTHRFEDLTEEHFRENFDINTVRHLRRGAGGRAADAQWRAHRQLSRRARLPARRSLPTTLPRRPRWSG